MKEQLRRWLDGELRSEKLPPELRERARRWEALFEDLRSRGPVRAPEGLESEVMRRVRAVDAAGGEAPETDATPGPAVRAVRWLIRPRPIPVPPAAGLAAAALVAFLVLRPPAGPGGEPAPPEPSGAAVTSAAAETRVYAEFVLRAPEADSVAVAGTFTDWSPSVALEDPDGDGVWSGRVPLEPGRHEYMFVVDGQRWVTDPNAQRYAGDGFGRRNAVLAVAESDARPDG